MFLAISIFGAFLLVFPAAAQTPEQPVQSPEKEKPAPGEVLIRAEKQDAEGPWRRLRGQVELESNRMILRAEEIDYNEDTQDARARGNVYFHRFESGEELWADEVEYNVLLESGKFHNIRGSSPVKIEAQAGVLASDNPFYFQGRLAERVQDKYILYDGLLTNCKMPSPWWTLRGPKFDIVPGQRALAYHSVFRIKGVPLFYTPYFYKSLEDRPRKSGFLTPNMGTSSRRGKMFGGGYYWAINRSYDLAYRAQYFTQRGVAHHVDLRGKPNQNSDFNAIIYGVNDRGLLLENGQRRKEGGLIFSFEGKSDMGAGFHARAEMNYLSSLAFRQAFTESFNEAIFSEVNSIGYVQKHWSTYGLDFVASRGEVFLSTEPDDEIVIRKMPLVEFTSRDRQIWKGGLPVWVSLQSSAGLVRRSQPLFQTRQYVERIDFMPTLTTALRWKGFHIIPSFGIRETRFGTSREMDKLAGENIHRSAKEFSVDLISPSLARVYDGPSWLGEQVKHVIEPRASFRHVAGAEDFNKLIRFDEMELLSNTTEAELSLTNRLYVKRNGQVSELLSWQLWQRRFFDPDFGGAIIEGQRNIVLSSTQLTPYAFLGVARNYSPIVSLLRLSPTGRFGLEWRSDYDPLRKRFVNSGLTADARFSNLFVSLGHNHVRSVSTLSPSANQFRGLLGVGNENRRGWNAAFSAVYDFREGIMQFATTQLTYNSDCCGLSFQYRRFSFGTRNENQFRVAFSVANIGSFGTLKKQEQLF